MKSNRFDSILFFLCPKRFFFQYCFFLRSHFFTEIRQKISLGLPFGVYYIFIFLPSFFLHFHRCGFLPDCFHWFFYILIHSRYPDDVSSDYYNFFFVSFHLFLSECEFTKLFLLLFLVVFRLPLG